MSNLDKLTSSEKSIYKYLTENKDVFSLSIDEIAKESFTSKATVSRFIGKMGFRNLIELKTFFFNFKNSNEGEIVLPTYENITSLKNKNLERIFKKISSFNIDQEVVSITKFIKMVKISEKIIICGQGTSKLPGIALENYFSRTNKTAIFSSDYEIVKQQILNASKGTLVILFSVSGESEIHRKLLSLEPKSKVNFISISSLKVDYKNVISIFLPKIDSSFKLKNNIIQLFFVDLISSLL